MLILFQEEIVLNLSNTNGFILDEKTIVFYFENKSDKKFYFRDEKEAKEAFDLIIDAIKYEKSFLELKDF